MFQISVIENEIQLKSALELCYDILGQHYREDEIYGYESWQKRLEKYNSVLLYAHIDGNAVAAVLGRPENDDSIIIGFTACGMEYRKQGITGALLKQFEENAKTLGFKYVTLGSDPDAEEFYKKNGYKVIGEANGRKILQKFL